MGKLLKKIIIVGILLFIASSVNMTGESIIAKRHTTMNERNTIENESYIATCYDKYMIYTEDRKFLLANITFESILIQVNDTTFVLNQSVIFQTVPEKFTEDWGIHAFHFGVEYEWGAWSVGNDTYTLIIAIPPVIYDEIDASQNNKTTISQQIIAPNAWTGEDFIILSTFTNQS